MTAKEQIDTLLEQLAIAADAAANLDDPESVAGNQEKILTAISEVQETLGGILNERVSLGEHLKVCKRLSFTDEILDRSLAVWLAGWDRLRQTDTYAKRMLALLREPPEGEPEKPEWDIEHECEEEAEA